MSDELTREQFKALYCERSKITEEEYDKKYVVMSCNCGDPECKEWASVRNIPDLIELHKELYQ